MVIACASGGDNAAETGGAEGTCREESSCCKVCDETAGSKACGDTCISGDTTCRTSGGCACDFADTCEAADDGGGEHDSDGSETGADSAVRDADDDGYAVSDGDCDDGASTVHPGANEVCNGGDDDCDGVVDEDVLLTFYRDKDGDGFGDLDDAITSCEPPRGYVQNGDDCDDGQANSFPGNAEACGDELDNDCDGRIDEGC